MRKYLLALASVLALLGPAQAADTTVSAMTGASALGGTELFYCVQGGADRKCTPAQINTYVASLWGTGVATFLTTPTSANLRAALTDEVGTGAAYFVGGALGTPASGTATNLTGLPISTGLTGAGAGVLTWMGTPTSANLASALTDETGSGAAVFGTAPTISSLNATTAMTLAFLTGSTQCLQVNTSGVVSGTGSACGAGGAGVSSIAGNTGAFTLNATSGITNSTNDIVCSQGSSSQFGCVKVDNSTITAAAGVISAAPTSAVPSTQTGTNYAIVNGDRAKVIYLSNAAAQTPTLPSAATLTNSNGWYVTACNINAGIQTITPTTSTIGGAASLALPGGSAASPRCVNIVSDGTNYLLVPSANTYNIASGTASLGTSAISAGTCASAVTVSAPGVVTTDVITVGFNGDPTATTGYLPTAMLTLVPYPTANNINIKACNLTGSSITPAAVTVNWRVGR